MYSTSAAYKTAIKQASRKLDIKITIGTSTYTSADISSITLEGTIQPSQGFTIGNSTSKMLKITFLNKTGLSINGTKLDLQVGVQLADGTFEYIPFKSFNIDDITTNDFTTDITCYDNMIKFEPKYVSTLTYPANLTNVLNEILSGTGVTCATTLPSVNVSKIEGYTKREVLGFIASFLGGNAVINRDGNLELKLLTDISSTYTISSGLFTLTKEKSVFGIQQLVCTVGNTDIASGDSSDTASTVSFKNPWMSQAQLDTIFNNIKTISYLGYSAKWQGDMALDLGDIIIITDRNGNTFKSPVLTQKFNFNGFTSDISAKGETLLRNKTQSTGENQREMDRTVSQQALNDTLTDYPTNDSLANALTNYPTNDDVDNTLTNYPTNDQMEQKLAQYGDNLILNGDFNEYWYNPAGVYPTNTSTLPVPYKILHWQHRYSNSTFKAWFEAVSSGVDGGMCAHGSGGSGNNIWTTVDLTNVSSKYILIEAYIKIDSSNSSSALYYVFRKDSSEYVDVFGETYLPGGTNVGGNTSYIAPTSSKDGWYYYSKLLEIPDGAEFVRIGSEGGFGNVEFWIDKVSVKAIKNDYKPSQQDLAAHIVDNNKHVNWQTVKFTSNLWTYGTTSGVNGQAYYIAIKHTLYSTNVNTGFVQNTDTGGRELCIVIVEDAQTIKLINDRPFNGSITIQKY